MDNYIRRQTVFNKKSERHMRIWSWIEGRTGSFKEQNYADFVREKLEWCMLHEDGLIEKRAEPIGVQPIKKGWSNLI